MTLVSLPENWQSGPQLNYCTLNMMYMVYMVFMLYSVHMMYMMYTMYRMYITPGITADPTLSLSFSPARWADCARSLCHVCTSDAATNHCAL